MASHHGCVHTNHHSNKKAVLRSLVIVIVFMTMQIVCGWWLNSLALLSDASHLAGDALALTVSLIALTLATKHNFDSRTNKFEKRAALFNGFTLLVLCAIVVYEAIERFIHPPQINGLALTVVSSAGLVANMLMMFILMRGDYKNNISVRSAFLHVLGDTISSIGALIAGICIWAFGLYILDPIISILIAIVVGKWAIQLIASVRKLQYQQA